jgi:hypothetical protein
LAQTVTVDLTTQYELIHGFGAGMKPEVDELYNMQERYRSQVLNLMFNDVDTRMLRTYVKASQYSTPDTGSPDVLDLDAMNFSVYAHDLWVPISATETPVVAESGQKSVSGNKAVSDVVPGDAGGPLSRSRRRNGDNEGVR